MVVQQKALCQWSYKLTYNLVKHGKNNPVQRNQSWTLLMMVTVFRQENMNIFTVQDRSISTSVRFGCGIQDTWFYFIHNWFWQFSEFCSHLLPISQKKIGMIDPNKSLSRGPTLLCSHQQALCSQTFAIQHVIYITKLHPNKGSGFQRGIYNLFRQLLGCYLTLYNLSFSICYTSLNFICNMLCNQKHNSKVRNVSYITTN